MIYYCISRSKPHQRLTVESVTVPGWANHLFLDPNT
jgi:hypothetical protein